MFRLQRFYDLQFCTAFFSNCWIFMYIIPNFSLENHFYLSYNVILQLWMAQKEPWTHFPTVSFPKAFSSNHLFPTTFLWHRLFMIICWLLFLYPFSIPSRNTFFSLLSGAFARRWKFWFVYSCFRREKTRPSVDFLKVQATQRCFFKGE